MLSIYLTIPLTVVISERSFSALKLIKSYLRSTMSQKRLNSLSLIYFEKELSNKINIDNVIDKFAAITNRRTQLK